jgi:hypothetical protein
VFFPNIEQKKCSTISCCLDFLRNGFEIQSYDFFFAGMIPREVKRVPLSENPGLRGACLGVTRQRPIAVAG